MKKIHYFIVSAALLLVILVVYMCSVPPPDTSKYIGIELNASGTKFAVFTLENNKYKIDSMDSDDRGTYFKESNKIGRENIDFLVASVKGLLSKIPKNNAPNENKYILISSFFDNTTDKLVLVESLKEKFKDYKVVQLNSVQEGEANFNTITEQEKFPYAANEILVVDLNSGKLSLSVGGTAVFTRTLDIGTKNTTDKLDPKDSLTSGDFECKVLEYINAPIAKTIRDNIDFYTKEKIIITGGIAFRICCENDKLNQQLPNIQPSDISDFKKNLKIRKFKCSFPKYSQKQLISGTTILECLQKHLINAKSYYDFNRHTWAPGFIVSQKES